MSVHAGPRPESLKWFKVYEWTNFTSVGAFAYNINNSASAPSFTRILYQIIYGPYAVWCEMDDFTSNTISRVGVPLTWTYETDVTNLKVNFNTNATSFPGASSSTIYSRSVPTGRINFWPSNYGTTGGNSALYDHDDDGYSTTAEYGSFQVFDMTPTTPECIFAWNAWRTDNLGDFGMGNKSTGNPDWTFTNNQNTFSPQIGRVFVQ